MISHAIIIKIIAFLSQGYTPRAIAEEFGKSLKDFTQFIEEELNITWDDLFERAEQVKNSQLILPPTIMQVVQKERQHRKYKEQSTVIEEDFEEIPSIRRLLQIAINNFEYDPSPAMLNAIVNVLRQTKEWEKELSQFSRTSEGNYGYYVELTEEQFNFINSEHIDIQDLLDKTISRMITIKNKSR